MRTRRLKPASPALLRRIGQSSRCQLNEASHVALIDRHMLDLIFGNRSPIIRSLSINCRRRISVYCNRLSARPHFQNYVYRIRLLGYQLKLFEYLLLKSVFLDD